MVTNSKTFVFGPSLALLRTDVEDYGSALQLAFPFEWPSRRNLRVGFEFAIGYAFGGHARQVCTTFTGSLATSCGNRTVERGTSPAILVQFNMGWSLGSL
jgi:hypothetical protein